MLTRHLLCTPAAGSGRRCFSLAVMVVMVLGLLAASACSHQPGNRAAGVRAAVQRAADELRAGDPAAASEVHAAIAEAEAISAAESSAWPWHRDLARVEAAWYRAVLLASRQVRAERLRRRQATARFEALAAAASEHVARARERLAEPGMGRREARAVALAEVQLRLAVRRAEGGDLAGATAAAEDAMAYASVPEEAWRALLERFDDPALLEEWRRAVDATVRQSRRGGGAAIVVDKLRRRLIVYRHGRAVASLHAELGANGLRPKHHSGDLATPEGQYRVVRLKSGSATRFYKALLIDYPSPQDRRRFAAAVESGAVPPDVGIGGLIEIHGEGGTGRDWTDGCVALTNGDMDWLFSQVTVGTPVAIVGTF